MKYVLCLLSFVIFNLSTQLESRANPASNTYQKPGADLQLHAPWYVNMQEQEVKIIPIEFLSPLTEGVAQFDIVPSEGLGMKGDTSFIVEIQAKTPIILPLELISGASGQFFLHIHASTRSGGIEKTRSLAIVISVGDEQMNTSLGLNKSTNPTKTYIALPAQEEIVNH